MSKQYRNDLTAEYVREIFNYDPLTGDLTWRVKIARKIIVGTKAGTICHGYMQVKIRGQTYLVHRIIWLYTTGKWPEDEIDHEDRNRANNIWTNLREATSLQNIHNRPALTNSKSGLKGVHQEKRCNKWVAQITYGGELIYIGTFNTAGEASQAYVEAARRLLGSFAGV
jgi:hypothetical protein